MPKNYKKFLNTPSAFLRNGNEEMETFCNETIYTREDLAYCLYFSDDQVYIISFFKKKQDLYSFFVICNSLFVFFLLSLPRINNDQQKTNI